jgi:spore coat protein A
MIIHIHGLTIIPNYDGHPQGYYTKPGKHGPSYASNSTFMANAVTFIYENKNLVGYYYFHDHTLSMTRSNVISGLKGVYQIISVN